MIYSKSVIATPPGSTIHEQLDNRGISQKEFAQRMGISKKHISKLINGKVELTPEVALRIVSVLGVPAYFWNNLEAIYRDKIARVKAENELEQDTEIAKKFPYAKIAAFGWVSATKNINEKVHNLRAFFEVARLGLLDDLCVFGIAYRKIGENANSDYALAAWAQKARLEARNINAAPINIEKLKNNLQAIRALTIEQPACFCNELRRLLSESGVVVVFLPHIGGSFLHGASFVDGNHIVLGLTVRAKDADRFWFSLFHELCHIIEGHIYRADGTTEEQERCADQFAKDKLISPDDYKRFIDAGIYSRSSIICFAETIGIDAGIVLGRLQKDNFVSYSWYKDLKTQYKISD